MIFLAAFVALFIWLGRRRGMAYWAWAAGYLACVLINLLAAYAIRIEGLTLVTASICILYLVVFLLWPWLADQEQIRAMEAAKQEYVREDELTDQRIAAQMQDWFVIKTYNDKEDAVRFQDERTLLETNGIASRAKSCLGLTTLAVEDRDVERACRLLGIDSQPAG